MVVWYSYVKTIENIMDDKQNDNSNSIATLAILAVLILNLYIIYLTSK